MKYFDLFIDKCNRAAINPPIIFRREMTATELNLVGEGYAGLSQLGSQQTGEMEDLVTSGKRGTYGRVPIPPFSRKCFCETLAQ